jgi:hypothetical protein
VGRVEESAASLGTSGAKAPIGGSCYVIPEEVTHKAFGEKNAIAWSARDSARERVSACGTSRMPVLPDLTFGC